MSASTVPESEELFPFDTSGLDISKARQQYGWAWFDFHARQRTTIFNYFLITLGLVINAYATLMQSGLYYIGALVAFAGAVAAYGFLCLEIRNSQLVHWGEAVLEQSERNFLFAGIDRQNEVMKKQAGVPGWHRPGIVSEEVKATKECWDSREYTHTNSPND
jgi:hypothetical protein